MKGISKGAQWQASLLLENKTYAEGGRSGAFSSAFRQIKELAIPYPCPVDSTCGKSDAIRHIFPPATSGCCERHTFGCLRYLRF